MHQTEADMLLTDKTPAPQIANDLTQKITTLFRDFGKSLEQPVHVVLTKIVLLCRSPNSGSCYQNLDQ